MHGASTCSHGKPEAILGLGDLETHVGSLVEARAVLRESIRDQAFDDMPQIKASALIALGEIEAIMENAASSIEFADQALQLTDSVSVKVPAARLFIAAGEYSRAEKIAVELVASSNSHDNAYGMMIEAMISRTKGEVREAMSRLDTAISTADLWLIRFEQARTQVEAGDLIASLETIGHCEARIGEATSVFLDDRPTIRYASLLPYWKGRSQEGLGMHDAAVDSFNEFLLLRPESGKYAKDASRRLEQIQ